MPRYFAFALLQRHWRSEQFAVDWWRFTIGAR
jgi:hypothetical protein